MTYRKAAMNPHRTATTVTVAAFAAVLFLTTGCTHPGHRPPPPTCAANQVAEWDADGWECEPDRNHNGRDDEDDAALVGGTHRHTPKPATPARRPGTSRRH